MIHSSARCRCRRPVQIAWKNLVMQSPSLQIQRRHHRNFCGYQLCREVMLLLNLRIGPPARPIKLGHHTVRHKRSVSLCRCAFSFQLDLIDAVFVGAERCKAAIPHQTNIGQSIQDSIGSQRSIRMQSVPLGRPLWEFIRHSVFLKIQTVQ